MSWGNGTVQHEEYVKVGLEDGDAASSMTLTAFLAVWGALLSTVLAGWTVFRDLRDRGKLQLDPSVGNIVPGDDKRDYLFLTLTNVGRRPSW
jgi:hypothetical protein